MERIEGSDPNTDGEFLASVIEPGPPFPSALSGTAAG